MKKTRSLPLLVLGCVLLPIAISVDNIYIHYSLLFMSIIVNIIAIIISFKEKKNNNL